MPLVRIDHAQGQPEGFGPAVGEIVYRAMMEEISVPADEVKFSTFFSRFNKI